MRSPVVDTTPTLDTTRNSEHKTPIRPIPSTIVSSNDRPPTAAIIIPETNKVFSLTFPAKRPVTWLAIIIPIPLIAKNKLNCCGDAPYIFCNTNGEPEI